MSSSAPTAVRAQLLEERINFLHFFELKGKYFAFDPVSVHLFALEPYEAILLKRQKCQCLRSNIKPRWTVKPVSDILEGLTKKGIFEALNLEARTSVSRVEVMVNAIQECNLNCSYCFVSQGRFSYGEERIRKLTPSQAERLVEVLPERLPWARHFCIHFYGGEPLLNLPAMQAAVDAATPMGTLFSFAVTTNGTICSKEAISVLKKGCFNVILSIDGPAPVHDAVRHTASGRPTHAKVMKFLDRVKAEKLFVRGSSVVRRGWSLREACSYLKTLPVDAIKAQAVRLLPGNPLALSEKERREYFEHLRNVANEVIASVNRREYPKDDRFNNRVLQLLCETRRDSFCGAGRWTFGMASDGTMLPCVLLAGKEGMSLGNIDDEGEWVERGRIWADRHGPRGECMNCWALPLCGGGCPAMLSVCGEDECGMVRANCEMALGIYGNFLERPADLLILAGVP